MAKKKRTYFGSYKGKMFITSPGQRQGLGKVVKKKGKK